MVDSIKHAVLAHKANAAFRRKGRGSILGIDKHITFSDNGLLKGMLSSALLSKGGKHLKSHISDNTTNINHLAFTVDHNDAFISHNWSTPGNDKYLILCWHLHAGPALCVVLAFKMLYSMHVVFGAVPCVRAAVADGEVVTAPGIGLLATPLFIFIVLTWGDVASFAGLPAPVVFFDKACISQTDQHKQRQGILSLAAFLNYSWSTVVIYTETYLARLWTVYEIASILTLHPRGHLFVYAPIVPKYCIAGSMMLFAFNALGLIIRYSAIQKVFATVSQVFAITVLVVFACPTAIVGVWIVRMWARERERARAAVWKFKAANAGCFCENDRSIVYSNIAVFMKHLKHVPADAALLDALNAFDNLVHDEVPNALQSFWGRVGIPYRWILYVSMPFFSHILEEFLGALHVLYSGPVDAVEHSSVRARSFVLRMFIGCTVYFFYIPLSVGCLSMCMRYCQHLQGIPEKMFISSAALLIFIFLLSGYAWLYYLQVQSFSSDVPVFIIVGFSICSCMASAWMYRRPRMVHHRRRFVETIQDQVATSVIGGGAQPASQSVGMRDTPAMDGVDTALAGEAASNPEANVYVEAFVAHASEVACASQPQEAIGGSVATGATSTDPLISTTGWQEAPTTDSCPHISAAIGAASTDPLISTLECPEAQTAKSCPHLACDKSDRTHTSQTPPVKHPVSPTKKCQAVASQQVASCATTGDKKSPMSKKTKSIKKVKRDPNSPAVGKNAESSSLAEVDIESTPF